MDIIVLESLLSDGISLPNDLKYTELSSQLTVPENLQDLANQNQIGLVMLKIVEIIGEDDIRDLDEAIREIGRVQPDVVIDDYIQLIRVANGNKDRRFQLEDIMQGHIIGETKLTGTFAP